MPKLHLIRMVRKWATSKSTISEFAISDADVRNGEIAHGYFLELDGPDTTHSSLRKRIPEGDYFLKWAVATRNGSLKRDLPLPWLYNAQVPDGRRIYIHVGNEPIHSDGCLLVGSRRSTESDKVENSRIALQKLKKYLDRVGVQNARLNIHSEY